VLVDIDGLPDAVVTAIANGAIALSPDGSRLALTWSETRDATTDSNLWVVNLDGSDRHRVTAPPDPTSPLSFSHGSPFWSPDGAYVGGVRFMSGTVTAPAYPNDDFSGSASLAEQAASTRSSLCRPMPGNWR
jgi:Tol biopolymer transport system component